jgi:hypothetical protein
VWCENFACRGQVGLIGQLRPRPCRLLQCDLLNQEHVWLWSSFRATSHVVNLACYSQICKLSVNRRSNRFQQKYVKTDCQLGKMRQTLEGCDGGGGAVGGRDAACRPPAQASSGTLARPTSSHPVADFDSVLSLLGISTLPSRNGPSVGMC